MCNVASVLPNIPQYIMYIHLYMVKRLSGKEVKKETLYVFANKF